MELSANLYKMRGEESVLKIKNDIITGVLGEYAVSAYVKSLGYNCSEPDLTIHKTRQKSFAADLESEAGTFHVKSQTQKSAQRYGASWIFQKEDRLMTLPSENCYLAFCLIDNDKVQIKAIVSNIDIVEAKLTKAPKIPKYAHTKLALYLDDILNSKINLRSLKCK